jgi:uncharacterized membrane protein
MWSFADSRFHGRMNKNVLILTAALGSAVNGGVFFAFSSFVMPALHRLPPPAAIAAMQSINVTAQRPAFMTALFGTAALTLATGVVGLRQWHTAAGKLLVLGSAAYLVGIIGLTIVYHVPLNNGLVGVDPSGPDPARTWSEYASGWTALNHVRAAAGAAGAGLLVAAAALGPR